MSFKTALYWRTEHLLAAVVLIVGASLPGFASAADLIEAARNQDLAAVELLLAQGAEPDATQADGATALHWAVFRSDVDMVTALINAGADVDAVNRLGASPLFIAAKGGNDGMIAVLLEAGAEPNIALPMGETPIMTASRSGASTGVRHLIDAGADVNLRELSRGQNALMWAAAQGHVEVARVLIDAGSVLESRSNVRQMLMYVEGSNGGAFDQGVMENLGGYSPLLFAPRQGHVEVARLLLDSGADIDGTAGNGASPLVIATHSGHTSFARFLLERGADANAIGAGYTALHAAILRGDLEIVNALLDHGADPNVRLLNPTPVQRASEDWAFRKPLVSATPYWLAAYFREPQIMHSLFDYGADPLLTIEAEYRPLRDRASRINPPEPEVIGGFSSAIQAAVTGDSRRDRFYVQANPDPVREEQLALETVRMAAEHGVNPDHTDFADTAALHDAASRNLATIVRELAQRGADINAINNRGQTPLDLATAAERRLGQGLLAQETPEYTGPTAREILESMGAMTSLNLNNSNEDCEILDNTC